MSTLLEIQGALADQIATELDGVVDNLQVVDRLVWNPTPPCIDVYPSDPFQEQQTFGAGRNVIYLDVRARVNTPDHDGAQEVLLAMMDPNADTSVLQAIGADETLGGAVAQAFVSAGPSNYGIFPDPSGQGAFLGCTWTVRVSP